MTQPNLSAIPYADEGLKRVYTWWIGGALCIVQLVMWMLVVSPSPMLHSALVLAAFVTWFHPLLRDAWPVFFKLSDRPVLRLDGDGIAIEGRAGGFWAWDRLRRVWLIDGGGKPMLLLRPDGDAPWPLADAEAAPILYSRPYRAGPYAGVINGQVLTLSTAAVRALLEARLGPAQARGFAGMAGWHWGEPPARPGFGGTPVVARIAALPALLGAARAGLRLAGCAALLLTIRNWAGWDQPDGFYLDGILDVGFSGLKLAVMFVALLTVLLGALSAAALVAGLVQLTLRPAVLTIGPDGLWWRGLKRRLAWDELIQAQLLPGATGHLTLVVPLMPGLHGNPPPRASGWSGPFWQRVQRLAPDPDRDTFRIPLAGLDVPADAIAAAIRQS